MSEVKEVKTEAPKATRLKVKSKEDIKQDTLGGDLFGNKQKIPANIQAELDAKGLHGRFVSIKVIQESGGYHPKGWTPYKLEKPLENPLTGTAEPLYRVGDLVLAVKTKSDYERHQAFLEKKASAQALEQKKSVQEMRDKIREHGASKHVNLLEGYDEEDDED